MSARHASGGAGRGEGLPALDVAQVLAGRSLLFTGATGFLGKVALSLLLDRYPDVGRIFVLVRPGTGGTPDARFFDKIVPGHPFDPLRARYGARFDAYVRERCVPLAGDVSAPSVGLSASDRRRLEGLAAVVHCAGLVDFNPSLELALGVNVDGARHAVELCRELGAALLHVSTCFVAGARDGVVFEDEPIVGSFPRRPGLSGRPKLPALDGAELDVAAELEDCAGRIGEVRALAEDQVQRSLFRARALERLRGEGRTERDEKALRLALAREKRLWISQRLVDLGMDRARHWGWPNTYTYTKALGEHVIAASGVPYAVVRPSIVESALRYPFPGWNEGFTTSAPLAFLGLKGHRAYPAAEKAILDVVPVDLVAAGILAATAELVERGTAAAPRRDRVYHLASGDVNPLWVRRSVELTALYRRRFYREREEGNRTMNRLLSRFEPYPVTRRHYETFSAPAFAAATRAVRGLIRDRAPRWGAPRLTALAHRATEQLDELESQLERTRALWDLYMPFVWEHRYVFRCAAIRELRARLTPADREKLPWDPEALDWRRYWLDVHMKGMEEWVFHGLEEQARKKVHPPRAHRDLLELLDSACERFGDRAALRMTGARKERFTYRELRRFADRVALFLAAAGIAKGDRVLLASENRPEWAIAYFGILRAGGVAVPVDPELPEPELANLWRTAGASLAILSDGAAERLAGLAARVPGARAVRIAEALEGGPEAPLPRSGPEDLASLIFTSGTTGTPKGVMLSHRNFASLVAKLNAVFDLGPGDGMLSVLPLHHTFEFSCGLLVPLSRGAEIEYLDELTADTIGDALESGRITAMIGVPALWSLLHRRITQELATRPGVVEHAFELLRKANAALRDSRLGWNAGKLLFWPVHRRLGGRLRILVSGGSALDPDVQEAFRELGFDLYEGYGLTEAAPVLAVSNPDAESRRGSVGPPLPGVELRIADPDASGVGEVLARGPNVMQGYWRGGDAAGVDPERTREVLEDGWLRTGDLGRLDADGSLTLVGRKKDVVIDADGKNVYPDEIEELYRDPELVKELSVVGLPDGAGEKLAMLVVPAYDGRDREEVRARIEAHLRKVSAGLPFHKRVKTWHLTDAELPKTATRKVKRDRVREELARLQAAAQKGRRARELAQQRAGGDAWLLDLLAEVSRRPRAEITHQTRLAADLAFDSLMTTELAAALEEAGAPPAVSEHLREVETVGELSRLVATTVRRPSAREDAEALAREEVRDVVVPGPLAAVGRAILGAGQRALYRDLYDAKVVGEAFIPRDRNFLVVANHASHLDMGLVKVALGDAGTRLAALAARDYFFDTRLKRAYFENFTNLIPMEREGALKGSLKAATEALRRGYSLLIFPEGTRSRDGNMAGFHPTAGYLALQCGVDTLPVYISGTHEALPPGRALPRSADLEVRIGPPIAVEALRARTGALAKSDAYKAATSVMEDAVRALGAAARRARGEPVMTSPPPPTGSVRPERTGLQRPEAERRPPPSATATATPPSPAPSAAPSASAAHPDDADEPRPAPSTSGASGSTASPSRAARGPEDA